MGLLLFFCSSELEYELFANEDDEVYIYKTKDLAPLVEDPDVITIKFWSEDDEMEEEE